MEVEFTKNKPQLILANRKKRVPVVRHSCYATLLHCKICFVKDLDWGVERVSYERENPETTTKNLEKKHLL